MFRSCNVCAKTTLKPFSLLARMYDKQTHAFVFIMNGVVYVCRYSAAPPCAKYNLYGRAHKGLRFVHFGTANCRLDIINCGYGQDRLLGRYFIAN